MDPPCHGLRPEQPVGTALHRPLTAGSVVDVLYRIRKNTGPYASPHCGGLEFELRALRLAAPASPSTASR